MTARLICILIGYVFGCFLTAEVVCQRSQGVSIFEVGSKNPGLANVAIEFGPAPAGLVFIGDALKVVIPVLIAWMLNLGMDWTLTCLWTGLGCTLGHNYPIWHKFSGGEGVMTTCSTIVLATPIPAILSLLAGAISVIITQFLNLSAVIICLIYTVYCWFCQPMEVFWLAVVFTVLSYIANRHAIVVLFTDKAEDEKVDVLGALKRKLSGK